MRKYLFLVCIIMILLLVGCETPHTHEFIEGVCGCGEVDPNYQAHTHNYVEGICECGKANPDYPGHEHEYIGGVCACGKIYKVPIPDEIIYTKFESVNDLINDYNQKKEEYKYNYIIFNSDNFENESANFHLDYCNFGERDLYDYTYGEILHDTLFSLECVLEGKNNKTPLVWMTVNSYSFEYSLKDLTFTVSSYYRGEQYFIVEIYDQSVMVTKAHFKLLNHEETTEEWVLNFVKENIVILK